MTTKPKSKAKRRSKSPPKRTPKQTPPSFSSSSSSSTSTVTKKRKGAPSVPAPTTPLAKLAPISATPTPTGSGPSASGPQQRGRELTQEEIAQLARTTGEQGSDEAFWDIMGFDVTNQNRQTKQKEVDDPQGRHQPKYFKGKDPRQAGAAPAAPAHPGAHASSSSSSGRGDPTLEQAIRDRALVQRRAVEELAQEADQPLSKAPARALELRKPAPCEKSTRVEPQKPGWVSGDTKPSEPANPPRRATDGRTRCLREGRANTEPDPSTGWARAAGTGHPREGLSQKVMKTAIKLDKMTQRRG